MTSNNHRVMQTTNQSKPPYRLKCIVLGSANAGKTCLLRHYTHGKFEDDIKVKSTTKRSTNSTLGADYYVRKIDGNVSVLLQLWDTAGKERLKPQKIPNEYDKKSNYYQFLSISIKDSNVKNTNNYEHRYNNWGGAFVKDGSNEQIETQVRNTHNGQTNSHQKHKGPRHYRRHRNHIEANKPLGDALFRNVHVCMLVYDATSSTSFLHLMQWHSELIQKLKQWEKEEMENEQSNDTADIPSQKKRRRRVPFVVVASKIDLIREEKVSPRMQQEYRSVMGFRDGDYRGKGDAYEYAVEDYSTDDNEKGQPQHQDLSPIGHKSLTYSLKETSWSNDATYLKSLQLTEDQLSANRLLILLWCERNRIPQ